MDNITNEILKAHREWKERFANATEEEQVTLYDKVASQADLTKTIDFSQVSSDTNGKGVYRFPGTENDTYPVYLYHPVNMNDEPKYIYQKVSFKMA